MRLVLILTVTILWVLCACGIFIPSPPPVNIGFFAGSDCVSACWQGLRPRQSTMNDVEMFLSQNFIELRTHVNENIKLITFYARDANWNYQVIATFKEDNLIDILLVADRPPSFDLQIDTILTTLGDPEYIRVGYETASTITIIYPYIELYYLDEGYIFYADLNIQSQSDDTIELCIQADVNMTEIHIVAPNPIQDMLADSIYYTGADSELVTRHINAVLNNLDNWTGYGCYTLPYYHPASSRN